MAAAWAEKRTCWLVIHATAEEGVASGSQQSFLSFAMKELDSTWPLKQSNMLKQC